MSTRVVLPQRVADWIAERLPVGNLNKIQFHLCRRIPFWWVVPGRTFAGLTLWNRIYVIEPCWCVEPLQRNTAELIVHELVHVLQYRRNPVLFPIRYLASHLKHGYDKNPAEVEARETAARVVEAFPW